MVLKMIRIDGMDILLEMWMVWWFVLFLMVKGSSGRMLVHFIVVFEDDVAVCSLYIALVVVRRVPFRMAASNRIEY